MKPKKIKFTVFIIVEPDGDRFHAYSPALKGLHVDGKSIDEAKKNAKDGCIVLFSSMLKNGDPIPLGTGAIFKKKKDTQVFSLNISVNLGRKPKAIRFFKSSLKRIAAQIDRLAE